MQHSSFEHREAKQVIEAKIKLIMLSGSYNDVVPTNEDYSKEAPAMPPHLQLTLLNVPPAMDAAAVLPRPQHVILSHLYCQRSSQVRL